nr:transposase family protein [Caulobacter sp. BE254]
MPHPTRYAGHPHGADPRGINARHDLASILFVALAATLCGTKTCVDIADFAASRPRPPRRQALARLQHASAPGDHQGDFHIA